MLIVCFPNPIRLLNLSRDLKRGFFRIPYFHYFCVDFLQFDVCEAISLKPEMVLREKYCYK